MRWVVLAVVVAAGFVAFVVLERSAAPAFSGSTKSSETPTRQGVWGARRWLGPTVNDTCHNICEPHCADRWGSSSWTHLLREGCYLNCIDVACKAQ